MANPDQLEIIKRGPDAWNEWREGHPDEDIKLTFALLSNFASRANLRGVNLSRANLSGAYLREADLTRANLAGADLREADLRGASLSRAQLTNTNLTSTHLTGANLRRANMRGADLARANLTGADLTGADLTGADLTGAGLFDTNFTNSHFDNTDFSGAILVATIFGVADLSSVRGLEAVRHNGPSIIDLSTIYRSQGKIPEAFLRGAGVPEGFIKLIPSLTEQPLQFYSCFISYSHNDKAFARRLYDGLQRRGIRCWLDDKDVLIGGDLYDAIDHGIRVSDKLLLCCSRASLTSWWVDDEIGKAFAKEQKHLRDTGSRVRVLIPLDLDGYLRKEWVDGKATQINRRLAADFNGWEHDNSKFEEQFEKVVKALRTDQDK